MILWIASYPKSGNTWVRALISTYLYSNDGKFSFDLLNSIPKFVQEKYFSPLVDLMILKKTPLKIADYWISAQTRINLDNQIKFFKTHNANVSYKNKWFTDDANTKGYIYVVRDPRAVACSLASHSKISIEEAVNEILNDNQIGYNGKYKLAEIPGSWKINYLSWKKKKNYNGIIIKYEDLIDNIEKEFKKILSFLGENIELEINKKKILNTINSCKFSNLSKMENLHGFKESEKNKFFRKGTKDSWKDELDLDLRKKIENKFKNEMNELEYL
tara:strand:+ start:2844 stop:3662 length:819 start_codon:yes stop_codon:yes gene_type:complete